MIPQVKKNPRTTAVHVANHLNDENSLQITVHTARRRLNEGNLFSRRQAKKTFISQANRKTPLGFAKRYLHCTSEDWAKVLWGDESKLNLFGADEFNYVHTPPN